MQLFYEGTDTPVQMGDKVTTFRGEVYYVAGWREPHKPGSTGRVHVDNDHAEWVQEFFPSVFRMEWR